MPEDMDISSGGTNPSPEAHQASDNSSQGYVSENGEKYVPQSQVDELAGRIRRETAEKTRRQMEQERLNASNGYQQQQGQGYQGEPNHNQSAQRAAEQRNQSQPFDEETLVNRAVERMRQVNRQNEIEQKAMELLTTFNQQMTAPNPEGSDIDDDLVKSYDPLHYDDVTFNIASMKLQNPKGVIHELMKHPEKLGSIRNLSGAEMQRALANLDNSLAQRSKAANNAQMYQTRPPLPRPQPSQTTGSDGRSRISVLRNKPSLM